MNLATDARALFMVSAYAKRGHIDSTAWISTSVMKFIEENWDLEPLAERDANANSFVTAFDFSMPPREPAFIPFERVVKEERVEPRRYVIYAAYGGALVLGVLMFIWTAVGSDLRRKVFAYFRRRTQPEGPLP
jgi:phospholipase C